MGCINDQEKKDLIAEVLEPKTDQYNKTIEQNSLRDQTFSCQRKQIKIDIQTNTTFTEKTLKREELILFPRLNIQVYNTESHKEVDIILITPNSVSNLNGHCLIKLNGIFYFGKDKDENDYVINQISNKEFSIKYENKNFYLTESNSDTGVFVKIQTSKAINEKKLIISFANSYLSLQILDDNKISISFHNNNETVYHTLNPNEDKQKYFKIGRGEECDIVIKSNSISRVQCSLIYVNNNWVIYDGLRDKPSLNGLW